MSGHFDRNETRALKSRESSLFRDFKAILSLTRAHAPALRRQTRDVNIATIRRGEDLTRIPVLRGAQVARMIRDDPPFGGRLATRPGFMRHLFFGTASGHSRDWWNAARAMHAAGFARGDIVLNCASYHMLIGGHMIEGGASELGCAVIPAGSSNTDRQLEAIRALRPTAFCGKPGALRNILERATARGVDVSSIKKAFVFDAPLSSHFRREAAARGIVVRQAYTTQDAGIVAFETSKPDGSLNEGMIVNEGVYVEIVEPGGETPVRPGETGEIVVTRLNVDLPVLRLGTGDLSRVLTEPSPCGRTNLRIAGWMGRAEDVARIGEQRVFPSQIIAMSDRHACVKRMMLVVNGAGAIADTTLRVEGPRDDPQLPVNLRATMQAVLGFEARVDIVAPGVLGDGARLIVDERARA